MQKTWSLDLHMAFPPFFLLTVLSNLSVSFFWKSCCEGDREGRSEDTGPLEVHKLTWGTRSTVRALKFDGGLRGGYDCLFALIRVFTLLSFLTMDRGVWFSAARYFSEASPSFCLGLFLFRISFFNLFPLSKPLFSSQYSMSSSQYMLLRSFAQEISASIKEHYLAFWSSKSKNQIMKMLPVLR